MVTKIEREPCQVVHRDPVTVSPDLEMEVIVVGPFAWGRGPNIHEAKANCRKNVSSSCRKGARYVAFLVRKGKCMWPAEDGTTELVEGHRAYVSGMGGIVHHSEDPCFCLGDC